MSKAKVVAVRRTSRATDPVPSGPCRATVREVRDDGWVVVAVGAHMWSCLMLEHLALLSPLHVDDEVLVLPAEGDAPPVILGRVGRHPQPGAGVLQINAPGGVSLRSGDAALEIRADGRVLLKGEDVAIHAKGTQRIRAGTVAIN